MSVDFIQLELKQGRVSFIPEGWELLRVGQTLAIKNNLRKPINQETRAEIQGQYPYYGPTKIQDWISSYEQDGTYATIGEDGDHFLKHRAMPMTQLIKGKCTVNNHAHVIASTQKCDSEWFFHYFRHRDISNFLTRQGAGRYKLNKEALQKIPMLVPPKNERSAITEILDIFDLAIHSTEKLIEQSKLQKKAFMQQLLTGKKRFPEFTTSHERKQHTFFSVPEDWNVRPLFEVFSRIRRKCNDIDDQPVLTISAGKGFILQSDRYSRFMAGKSLENYTLLKKGEFSYNKGNSKTYECGCVYPLENHDEALVPNIYVSFASIRNTSESFYKYYFEADLLKRQLMRINNAGVRNDGLLNIRPDEFMKIEIVEPPLEEQRKIASVLSECDRELELLNARLQQLKQQKKGLMQQLLTGKIRVKV